ncbi:hypothetical protein Tco_0511056 [Tanacetum coccineum]
MKEEMMEGADDFVKCIIERAKQGLGSIAQTRRQWVRVEKSGEIRDGVFSEFDCEDLSNIGKENIVVEHGNMKRRSRSHRMSSRDRLYRRSKSRIRIPIKRDVANRWLCMRKDIDSCGSKYLAYLDVEVGYQGSSGLLLQPELPE